MVVVIYDLCNMHKLTADYILNPSGKLVTGHLLIADDKGKIIDLVQGSDSESVHHHGILTPGFINTHCHLELSHLKNQIPGGTGLEGFIRDIVATRKNDDPEILPSIIQANQSMWDEGIQGIGDICNTNHTFYLKKSSKIRYHSFIELFNFKPAEITSTFEGGLAKYAEAIAAHQNASLVPHAPYSVPPMLFELIKEHYHKNNAPWSIHNQESAAENEMFRNGTGVLWDGFKTMGVDLSWFHPTEKNSLASISKYFPADTNLLLVHNTASSKSDIEFLQSANLMGRTWLSQCPNTNLFIEKKLPQIKMFYEAGCKITVGTDSLASNSTLSIIEELKTIHVAFPEIPVEELLSWATINGASYFKWNDFGSFIKNNTPGIILISHSDEHMIHADSRIKRIF